MTTEQINNWRYPPVPQAIAEALKNYPELIAHAESWLRDDHGIMSDNLPLSLRVDGVHWSAESLKEALMHFSSQARARLEAAQTSGDAAAITAAQAEREAISVAWNADLKYWDELIDFYGLVWPADGTGARIKEGM